MAGWLSWLRLHPIHQKNAGLIPSQGTFVGCGFDPWPGRIWEAMCVSLPHPLFLSPLPQGLKEKKKDKSSKTRAEFGLVNVHIRCQVRSSGILPDPACREVHGTRASKDKDRCTISLQHRKGPWKFATTFYERKMHIYFVCLLKLVTAIYYIIFTMFQRQKLPWLFIFGMNGRIIVCSSHTKRVLTYF